MRALVIILKDFRIIKPFSIVILPYDLRGAWEKNASFPALFSLKPFFYGYP